MLCLPRFATYHSKLPLIPLLLVSPFYIPGLRRRSLENVFDVSLNCNLVDMYHSIERPYAHEYLNRFNMTAEPGLPPLLRLPPEIRELIFRPSLSTTCNHESLPTRPQEERAFISTLHVLTKNSPLLSYLRRTVWMGDTPETTTTTTCSLEPALLRACKRLHQEGAQVIYKQNQYVGIIVDRNNYGSSLRRAGIKKHWGHLPLPELSVKTVSGPSNRRPSPAITFKFDRALDIDDQHAEHWMYLCCMEGRERVLSSPNDALEIADASQHRNMSLRIWLPTKDEQLQDWVLSHVLPFTRVYTTSVICGAHVSGPLEGMLYAMATFTFDAITNMRAYELVNYPHRPYKLTPECRKCYAVFKLGSKLIHHLNRNP